MKKTLFVMTLILALALTGAWATGGVETVDEASMVQPMDSGSSDPLLRNGLLAIPDTPTKIELYTAWSGDSFKLIEQFLTDVFGVLYPNVEVEPQSGESAEMVQVINTRLAAGNPPDVVMAASSYFMKDWAESGALYDMSSVWEEFDLESIIPQGVANSMSFGGNYYGLPFVVEMNNVLYWNENVLAEGGVPAPPYDSWDDFFAAAEAFNAPGKS
ncbi:MAG: extracellular solute-binding protein, partial [Spirochaetaceae bacterium]|nr:extracellular solute-binding protein [Spirochaetaceae bacterium]